MLPSMGSLAASRQYCSIRTRSYAGTSSHIHSCSLCTIWKKIQKAESCKRLKDVLRIHRVVSLDPESQRNGKEKKISEMWQYSNIPYINDFFFFVLKLLHYLPKSSHFKKNRSECYCNDKETTETKLSGYYSPMVLRFPLF